MLLLPHCLSGAPRFHVYVFSGSADSIQVIYSSDIQVSAQQDGTQACRASAVRLYSLLEYSVELCTLYTHVSRTEQPVQGAHSVAREAPVKTLLASHPQNFQTPDLPTPTEPTSPPGPPLPPPPPALSDPPTPPQPASTTPPHARPTRSPRSQVPAPHERPKDPHEPLGHA